MVYCARVDKDAEYLIFEMILEEKEMTGAFETGLYPNFFELISVSREDAAQRVADTFNTMFFDEEEKIWHDTDADSACLVDTGNIDARTEGMSYGMMMCVQLNRQDLFDRLLRFSLRYMRMDEGKHAGYFAWSVQLNGKKNAWGPAPDGEEYYAAALFMAAARWESEEFDYLALGRDILRHCVHQAQMVEGGFPMWDPDNKYIRFVPETLWSDPSYHLPHFYELFALCADACDRAFWKEAAQASREYIALAADDETGLSPEYAEYDGTPHYFANKTFPFFSDAYRVASNIALHRIWCGEDAGMDAVAERLQRFMLAHPKCLEYACDLKGKCVEEPVMHPVGLVATLAAASAVTGSREWLQRLWDMPLRKGVRRYYDNCLYLFALMMLSGNYRIYLPEDEQEDA